MSQQPIKNNWLTRGAIALGVGLIIYGLAFALNHYLKLEAPALLLIGIGLAGCAITFYNSRDAASFTSSCLDSPTDAGQAKANGHRFGERLRNLLRRKKQGAAPADSTPSDTTGGVEPPGSKQTAAIPPKQSAPAAAGATGGLDASAAATIYRKFGKADSHRSAVVRKGSGPDGTTKIAIELFGLSRREIRKGKGLIASLRHVNGVKWSGPVRANHPSVTIVTIEGTVVANDGGAQALATIERLLSHLG